ncbi:MAG: pyridoxamine 5'-phosphate oxidase family protein [Chloroflexi bacterium]|nr:pyridoxamine 5'-phosphate oxidase family protein [Chloroflexota bacterium]
MSVETYLNAAQTTIKEVDHCMLVTYGSDGLLHSRLMQPYDTEESLDIWFGTRPDSRKVEEIQADNRALVMFYNLKEAAYVSMNGTIEMVDDPELKKQYWHEAWEDYFERGPEGDDYMLLKFVPNRIEQMNFAQKVAPEPYGRVPAIMVRQGDSWVVAEE